MQLASERASTVMALLSAIWERVSPLLMRYSGQSLRGRQVPAVVGLMLGLGETVGGTGVFVELGVAEGWTLVVEDNGPGIEPAIAGMIFEPLFTTEETGLGLGLSICKSIVEGHHGTICVEERDTGPGARFRIALPIKN